MRPRTERQIADLRNRIQQRLDARCRDIGFHLKVSAIVRRAENQEHWLFFVVVPDTDGVRAYDYAMALADVELELRRNEGEENMLLVPAMPG